MVDRSHTPDDDSERADPNVSFPQSASPEAFQPGDLVTCGCASMRVWQVIVVYQDRVWLTAPDCYPPEDLVVPLYRLRRPD